MHAQDHLERRPPPGIGPSGSGCATDAEILAYARATGSSIYHPSCTARMGADALAVVGADLRVAGVGGLRVADASVFPAVVSGNTNAVVVALAEKAADLIRADRYASATRGKSATSGFDR